MRILFIRHGDPDYEHDALTENGKKEARLLAKAAPKMGLGACFVSPLGRAQETASYVLDMLGCGAQTLDWLQEFPAKVDINMSKELQAAYPDTDKSGEGYCPRIAWDMLPSYWLFHPEYSDKNKWRESEAARCSDLVQVYDHVTNSFDKFLELYGYVREGGVYRVKKENTESVTFFCHLGVTCAILSHLWGISPFLLWHSLAPAPTSVTEIVTEERERGTAYFRTLRIGDVSHLYASGAQPSFSGRFCEVYGNTDQRH